MKSCDALNEFRGEQLWCSTHDLAANHLADNGDDWICEAFAIFAGCQCCSMHDHKCNMSNHRRALEFIFDKLITADSDAEKVVILEVKKVLGIRGKEE